MHLDAPNHKQQDDLANPEGTKDLFKSEPIIKPSGSRIRIWKGYKRFEGAIPGSCLEAGEAGATDATPSIPSTANLS